MRVAFGLVMVTVKRTTHIMVRLTPKEKAAIETKANAAEMTLSDYIRHCVERRSIAPPIPEINRLTYHQLAKIALNLSHAIASVNVAKKAGHSLPFLDEVARTTTDALQVVREIQSQLLGLL